jgi:putative restriction endonuclease
LSSFGEAGGSFRFEQTDVDAHIRSAAFAEVQRLSQLFGNLTPQHLAMGFQYHGVRIPLVNPQRGIFKPKQMRHLLSIKTVYPRPGRKVWYDDQREVHQQIFNGDQVIDYAFMGDNPDAADNRWLRDAMEFQIPVIYFLGTAPGFYQAIAPTFIVGFDPGKLRANLAFASSISATAPPRDTVERRYALRSVKQRLHQASFRQMVIDAYRGRCAISGLPEPILLDAAHIASDADEQFGQPIVNNGIPLSKLHHAAFDAHLIGIDPDFRIHVSRKLMDMRDGPTLEALRQFDGGKLILPNRANDLPDRDRLAVRFDLFKSAA